MAGIRGKAKASPSRRRSVQWRPGTATKRGKQNRTVSATALTKATRTLEAVDTLTQRGNIKVVVRVRPVNDRENNARLVVHAVDEHMVLFDPPDEEDDFYYRGVKQIKNYQQKVRHKNVKLAFDNVYGCESTNLQIFSDVIDPMLDTLLNGFNCSVFAYGATGSGKTHTMLGKREIGNPGLTFLTVMELYSRLDKMKDECESEVTVSYLEVYNETVKDLIRPSGDLNLREDHNGVVVPNLTTHRPASAEELMGLLTFGNGFRSQHPTDHNAESSRSHAVFMVYINLRSRCTELTNKYKSAKLVMVDLAGSEKGCATGFQGQRFREGASINKSLLSLGNCINALADGKKHIPYRDSKLTRILKDSLGGNCKTVMIANVSPSDMSYDDSYNTLRYADRAKRIKCQAKKNIMSVTACLTQYTKIVEEMGNRLETLLEDQKNCRCKIPKVHAYTEIDEEILGISGITCNCQNQSVVPKIVTDVYLDLVQRKTGALQILLNASATAATMATKIRVKEKRIKSIKKFSTSGVREEKNTKKLKGQLGPLQSRQEEALLKKSNALNVLNGLEEEWMEAGKCSDTSDQVNITLGEYLEFQKLKVENLKLEMLKDFYKQTSRYFLEEWQKAETMVSKSVEFLNAQYLLTKHFGHTTTKMDSDYEALAANLCGTHVHFSETLDAEDEKPSPPINTILEEEGLMEMASGYDESTKGVKDRVVRFKRPPTPPRKAIKSSDYGEFDLTNETYDDPSELGSFASETSALAAIAGSGTLLPTQTEDVKKPDNLNAAPLNTSYTVEVDGTTIGVSDLTPTSSPDTESTGDNIFCTIPSSSPKETTFISINGSMDATSVSINGSMGAASASISDSIEAKSTPINDTMELSGQEASESFEPVPVFLTDKSYMKIDLDDEHGRSPPLQNPQPMLMKAYVKESYNSTFCVDGNVPTYQSYRTADFDETQGWNPMKENTEPIETSPDVENSTFCFDGDFNATFDVGAAKERLSPPPITKKGTLPLQASGAQTFKLPVKKVTTSTSRSGSPPVATTTPSNASQKQTKLSGLFSVQNKSNSKSKSGRATSPKPGNSSGTSGLTRFSSQSNMRSAWK